MRTIQDKIRNVAIGFFAIFIIGIINLFIPFAIFAAISGINDFSYFVVYTQLYWFNATEMIVHDTYLLIIIIVQIIIYYWILSNLREIELDLLGGDNHFIRTRKYFFLSFIYSFLVLYGAVLLILVMFSLYLAIILLGCAIAGLVGTAYFAIFLYNIGKETDNMLIKVGGILFILGPILSAISILISLPALFSFGSFEFSYIFYGIIGFVDNIISGVGFYLLINNYDGTRYERRASLPPDYRSEPRGVPRYQPSRPSRVPPPERQEPQDSWRSPTDSPPPPDSRQVGNHPKCPNCGNPCPPADQFCRNCGRFIQ